MLLVALLLTSCSEPVAEEVPPAEPEIVYVTEHIWHETTIETTVDVYHTTVVVEEDTTPDVIETTEYVYPSGPVPCLVLEEGGVPAMADGPLSGLTAATQLEPADLMLVTQSGTSKQAALDLLRRILLLDPKSGFVDHTEWISDVADILGWASAVSGLGASIGKGNPIGGRANLVYFQTGTTTTGRTSHQKGSAGTEMELGDGETAFETSLYIPTLSDGTNRFVVYAGFGDTFLTADYVDGVYFRYSDNLQAGNWEIATASNSTRTQSDSGIAVAAATWYNLAAVVNAAGTSVEFFIDGVSVGTITTNIPTGASRVFSPNVRLHKSLGTTNRTMYEDFFQIRKLFTSLR
jgi:hypothetical protein